MTNKLTFIFISLLLTACAHSSVDTQREIASRDYWPTDGWQSDKSISMQSASCQDFVHFLTQNKQAKDGLQTDQLIVIKHGRAAYEWTDGTYKEDTPHCMWSASKTVGAMLAATAIQDGKLSLDEKLADFYPESLRDPKSANEQFYKQIKVSNLFAMDAGFAWHEDYDEDLQHSSILDMIYLDGHKDVATYAAKAPLLANGPGKEWVYSSGDLNLLMGILKQKYGKDYNDLPWHNLFDKIGTKNIVFEQDASGTFVGSSYVHASARDMAKIGYLMLNDGVWNGERILPEGWMQYVRSLSPAVNLPDTPKPYIVDEGVYGHSVWLNQDVQGLGLPFPNSPKDLYFAGGHYGQLIYVIPSLDLVIARTGHDVEYWSKIDGMVSRAVACFGDVSK